MRAFSEQRELPRQRGASGLDISDGKTMLRPTSPAAWLVVRSQLQELGVKLVSSQELLFAQV